MSELRCRDVRPTLEGYIDRELTAGKTAAVRDHLEGCADCRLQHAEAASIPTRLRALRGPEPPAELLGNVLSAVKAVRAREDSRSRIIWKPVVAEVILSAIIGWYISGFAGLTRLANATFSELAGLLGWSSGTAALPAAPSADLVLVLACLSLIGVTAWHLMLIARNAAAGASLARPVS